MDGHYAATNFAVRIFDKQIGSGQAKFKPGLSDSNVTTSKPGRRMIGDTIHSTPKMSSDVNLTDSQDIVLGAYPGWDPRLALRLSAILVSQDPVCPAVEFYYLLAQTIDAIAATPPSDIFGGVTSYYKEYDYSFVITATSAAAAAAGTFKREQAIGTLVMLSEWQAELDLSKRFHPFEGVIQWNGAIVGKFVLFSGKVPPAPPVTTSFDVPAPTAFATSVSKFVVTQPSLDADESATQRRWERVV